IRRQLRFHPGRECAAEHAGLWNRDLRRQGFRAHRPRRDGDRARLDHAARRHLLALARLRLRVGGGRVVPPLGPGKEASPAALRMVAMHPSPLMRDENPCLWDRRATICRPGVSHRPGRGAMNRAENHCRMSASDQASAAASPGRWLANQPYLLLSITALFWAGNAIVGRLAAGHIPPVTLAFLRWLLAFLIILPIAWKHLAHDWSTIRATMGTMIVLSITGISAFTSLQYWSLEHTTALNTLLLQSAGPLFVAGWSLILLGV